MNRLILLSILVMAAFTARADRRHDHAKPNYVGAGRYTCHEKTTGCTVIKDNNRRITQNRIDRAIGNDRKHYTPLSERPHSPLAPRKGNDGHTSPTLPNSR